MTETAALLSRAQEKQASASDPAASVWVRANAGTGKTHVLVQRILRLLLSGAETRSILCLTYTKSAAAEMQDRVLRTLGEWATAPANVLAAKLTIVLGRAATEAETALARCLFATVVDAPGGLPMMTIHSLCERILRRFSMEAGVPPGFAILTEDEGRVALQAATQAALQAADADTLSTIAAYTSDDEFDKVLKEMLCRRSEIFALLSLEDGPDPVGGAERRLRAFIGLAASDNEASLLGRMAWLITDETLAVAVAALSTGSANDTNLAKSFRAVVSAQGPAATHDALREAFLTKEGAPRKTLMTKAVMQRFAALHEQLEAAQAEFVRLNMLLCAAKVSTATAALLRLSNDIFQRYDAEKQKSGAVDFDDLIDRALRLLTLAESADWILHELDARIDHILVDEAQDTSPAQWAIIERLTGDFFAGVSAREKVPTVFAVGDEKQSIYGFQGANPELLLENGLFYETQVRSAKLAWRMVDLDLSFRTLSPILNAVDRVCAAIPDLSGPSPVPHLAYRREGNGLVELWEPETAEKQDKGSVWEPERDAEQAAAPAAALAARIARHIKHWLDQGEVLPSTNRAISPGDILILLRKREPMSGLLQAALKACGVPVAGMDRMALLDALPVMDLLALADAMLLRHDDLSLACVMKSPLIGFDDDHLFDLACGRPGSLWDALMLARTRVEGADAKAENERILAAAQKLEAWHALAQTATPFEFFAHILEADGGREAFAARLGSQCHEPLDELLTLAESFAGGSGDLTQFLAFVRESAATVKRESEQAAEEVRIMTIHGAKGLEAPVVIMADTCGDKASKCPPVLFVDDRTGKPPLAVWAIKGAAALPCVESEKEDRKTAEARELSRLLYVGMTRARDRLYICGSHGKKDVPKGSWYETIQRSLSPVLQEALDFEGRKVWQAGAVTKSVRREVTSAKPVTSIALPSWTVSQVDAAVCVNIQYASKLNPAPSPSYHRARVNDLHTREEAQARGTLFHRLLELLPTVDQSEREGLAHAIVAAFPDPLSPLAKANATTAALKLVADPAFALKSLRSVAEAGLAFCNEDGAIMIGRADRIVFHEGRIVVVDYKSGRTDDVAWKRYGPQLEVYTTAMARLYPGVPVEPSIILMG